MKKQDDKTSLEAPKEWRWYQMGAGSVHKAEASIARWISIVISATAIGTTLGMLVTVPNLPQFKSFAYVDPYNGFSSEINVELTEPVDYSMISGKDVIISANATSSSGIQNVNFYLDSTAIFLQSDNTAPYSIIFDSTAIAEGPHNVFIKAYNSSGNWGYDVGYITVRNTEDVIPPTISITKPISESNVSGIIELEAISQDDRSIHRVEFYQDNNLISAQNIAPQQQLSVYDMPGVSTFTLDTRSVSNGMHVFTAKAYDEIDTFSTGQFPGSIAYDSRQKAIWVSYYGNSADFGSLQKFNAASGVLLKEISAYRPGSITYDSTQNAIWVTSANSDKLDKYDAATGNRIGTYNGASDQGGFAYDSVNNAIWIRNYNQVTKKWQLNKINAATGNIEGSFSLVTLNSMGPTRTEYDSAQNAVWVTYGGSAGMIQRYNAATGEKIGSDIIKGQEEPYDIAYDQAHNAIWVVNLFANTLEKYNAATGEKIGTYLTEIMPRSLAYDSVNNVIVVVSDSSKLEKYNAATGEKIGSSIIIDSMPISVAVDQSQNMLWVVNNNASTLQRLHSIGSVNSTVSAPITININNAYPAVAVTAPTNGSTVSGTQVMLSAEAFDDNGPVQQVDFSISINGSDTILGSDIDYPYEQVWDSTMVANGTYVITAKVTDSEGNTAISDPITVIVENAPRIPPTAVMTAPEANSSVKGIITVSADASDDAGVIKVEFYKDADLTPFATSLAPISGNLYSGELDTASMTDGDHMLYAVAYDDIGLTTSANVIYAVVDNTPPAVSLIAPADGSTISGKTVLFSVNAADNAGIKQIDYYSSAYSPDTILGTYITSPYNMTWDSTVVSNGTYSFTAKATDVAGNTTISSSITLTLLNDATPPTAPGRPTENSNHASTTLSSDQDYDSDGCYRVYWTKASDAESGIVAYNLQERLGTSGSWVVAPTTDLVTLNYMKCGALQNTKYFYRVRAKNNAGLWSLWSSVSDGILVDKTAPSAVSITDDGATTTNRTSFHVKWTASADAESGISGYTYYLRKDSTRGTMVKQGSLSKTAIETTITGLTLMPGTTYYITIFAKNNAGISGSLASSDGILIE